MNTEHRGMPWLNQNEFKLLISLSEHIQNKNENEANKLIERLEKDYKSHPPHLSNEKIFMAFLEALKEKLQKKNNELKGNLYADNIDIGAMISAFEVLVKSTPFIKFAYSVANEAIIESSKNESELRIMDIGVGGGQQWYDFLTRLKKSQTKCKKIQLLGIDIPPENSLINEKLIKVGKDLEAFADKENIAFSFIPISAKIETLNLFSHQDNNIPLIINALLAIHHTPSGDAIMKEQESRLEILKRLKKLNPLCTILVEPDSNHDDLPLTSRVQEALGHYSTVFEALDCLLDKDLPERKTIEKMFFGKEIANIVIGEKSERVERHQRRQNWNKVMTQAGFSPKDLSPEIQTKLINELNINSPFNIQKNAEMLTLEFKHSPLLTAMLFS